MSTASMQISDQVESFTLAFNLAYSNVRNLEIYFNLVPECCANLLPLRFSFLSFFLLFEVSELRNLLNTGLQYLGYLSGVKTTPLIQ